MFENVTTTLCYRPVEAFGQKEGTLAVENGDQQDTLVMLHIVIYLPSIELTSIKIFFHFDIPGTPYHPSKPKTPIMQCFLVVRVHWVFDISYSYRFVIDQDQVMCTHRKFYV